MIRSEAYEEGYQDYFSGKDKKDNPYDDSTENGIQWLKGYKKGVKEDVEQDPDGN